jgi:hypothetical protein
MLVTSAPLDTATRLERLVDPFDSYALVVESSGEAVFKVRLYRVKKPAQSVFVCTILRQIAVKKVRGPASKSSTAPDLLVTLHCYSIINPSVSHRDAAI